MTIQYDQKNNRVRIGDKFFPALNTWKGAFTIPMGESGVSISICICPGSYSSNRDLPINSSFEGFDNSLELETVEVGFEQTDGNYEVLGWQSADDVILIIDKIMDTLTPKALGN